MQLYLDTSIEDLVNVSTTGLLKSENTWLSPILITIDQLEIQIS